MRLTVSAIVLSLFAISCTLIAGHGQGGFLEEGFEPPGWRCLVFGWMGARLDVMVLVVWLANPLLLVALICLWRECYAAAAASSIVATGLSLIPVALLGYFELRLDPPIALVSYGGRLELRLGYVIWVWSHLALFLSASVMWYWRRTPNKT